MVVKVSSLYFPSVGTFVQCEGFFLELIWRLLGHTLVRALISPPEEGTQSGKPPLASWKPEPKVLLRSEFQFGAEFAALPLSKETKQSILLLFDLKSTTGVSSKLICSNKTTCNHSTAWLPSCGIQAGFTHQLLKFFPAVNFRTFWFCGLTNS